MEWIYTKDKLPSTTMQVLVAKGEIIMVMMYNHETNKFSGNMLYWNAKDVTAWMPLPKLPIVN